MNMSVEHLKAITEQARNEWSKGGQLKQAWNELEPELRELCSQGWGVARLAKRYGVSAPTIRKWMKRLGVSTAWQQLRACQ